MAQSLGKVPRHLGRRNKARWQGSCSCVHPLEREQFARQRPSSHLLKSMIPGCRHCIVARSLLDTPIFDAKPLLDRIFADESDDFGCCFHGIALCGDFFSRQPIFLLAWRKNLA